MLEYSALLFIIPALYAYYKNNLEYGNAFLFLIITSYVYHRSYKSNITNIIITSDTRDTNDTSDTYNKYNNFSFWIDQFAIFNIVLIGIYHYITYCKNYYCKIFIFIGFISCIILYLLNKINFNEDIHLYIHIITLIVHTTIIYGY